MPVYRAVHEPGTFMFTSPGAYHAGLNTGFNVAESTNFAFPDWLPAGTEALRRYRTPGQVRDSTLLHDALLCTVAQHAQRVELPDVVDELRRRAQEEAEAAARLGAAGVQLAAAPAAEVAWHSMA